jgi:aspartate/methionine/tyrosine aminotransferase
MTRPYMEWSKLHSNARYRLAGSGMLPYPLAELPVKIEDIELNGPNGYGYAPLLKAIAVHAGVAEERVAATHGASMANYLTMAVTLQAGDEALIERPAYELLVSAAQYLGANIRRFDRKFEDGFRIDPEEIERHITPRTRLIVLTNLHNPSSAATPAAVLREIGAMAHEAGACVLVAEIYRRAAFEQAPESAAHLGDEFIVTDSLTKVYGLGGLRCGWAIAHPDLVRKMWRLYDLFGVDAAHPAERLSCVAFANLDRIAARARRILDANRAKYNAFLSSNDHIEGPPSELGTVAFPRLRDGRAAEFARLLSEKCETSVVPGDYFDMPGHIRIGLACDPAVFSTGLERVGQALNATT